MQNILFHKIQEGDIRSLARAISFIENESVGYTKLLEQAKPSFIPVIGVTGVPGAGKSSLIDALINNWITLNKKIGVLCIDPSSPFTRGALLGDRIRMTRWYNHPNVFIRSLATRGSLGGLSAKTIEVIDVMKLAPFDVIIVETVGAGQNEVEIAGLADITVVVLIPGTGDDIQDMKAGLMEIADIFVVNKSDKPGADLLVKNLHTMLLTGAKNITREIPIIKTVSNNGTGVTELFNLIEKFAANKNTSSDKKYWLLAEKAFHLIQLNRMKDVNLQELYLQIKKKSEEGNGLNLYQFVQTMLKQ